MGAAFQAIVNGIYLGFTFLANVVRNLVHSALQGVWMVVRYVTEFVWNWTIGIAQVTLEALMAQLGLRPDIDLEPFQPYLEVANYWLPVGEGLEAARLLYAFYFFVFAYRWVRWAVPFI